jgi:hypothetical protein
MAKGSGLLLDLSQLTGAECTIEDMAKASYALQPPPLTPTAFAEKLRDDVSSKRLAFTNGGDVDVVAEIYKRAFTNEFGRMRRLCFCHREWSDAQGEEFSAVFQPPCDTPSLSEGSRTWKRSNWNTIASATRA